MQKLIRTDLLPYEKKNDFLNLNHYFHERTDYKQEKKGLELLFWMKLEFFNL